MSNQSDSISYQQFEISTASDIYQSRDIKLKREGEKIFKFKIQKIFLVFLTLTFFILFLIVFILYLKKSYDYNNLETKVLDHIFFPYHSDLISTLKILKKLKNWVKKITYQKTGIKYNPSLRMYYKATIDGDYAFHEKTDRWEGYILLIKDSKNNIFGGYTSKNFRPNSLLGVYYGSEKVDKTAFLFNLNKNEIYPIINDNANCHIYGDIEDGPVFGSYQNSDLSIASQFLSVKSYSEFPKSYNLNGKSNIKKNILRLTNGQKRFLIKELEVFRVNLLP
jgi:hypothetical protein